MKKLKLRFVRWLLKDCSNGIDFSNNYIGENFTNNQIVIQTETLFLNGSKLKDVTITATIDFKNNENTANK